MRDPGHPGSKSKVRWILAAVVVVALAVAGGLAFVLAGGDDDSAPDLSASELEGALLTVDDVGEGFSEEPADDDDELDPDDLDASDECKELLEVFDSTESTNTMASREFRAESGESVSHSIAIPSDDAPKFDELANVVDECDELSFSTTEVSGTMRIAEGEPLGVGERSFTMESAVELTEPLEATFTFVVIYWERDGLISWVEVAPSIGAEVDDGEARTLAETADGRLVELLDSAD